MIIEESNLPDLIQVAAADCLKIAYDLYETDADRIKLFLELLTVIVPSYQWNAVVHFQYLYFYTIYYIKLSSNNGDIVFAFSSNN